MAIDSETAWKVLTSGCGLKMNVTPAKYVHVYRPAVASEF